MLHNFIGYWRSMYAGNGVLSIMKGSLYNVVYLCVCKCFIVTEISF